MAIERTPRGRVFTVGEVTKDTFFAEGSVTLSASRGATAQEFYLVKDIEGADAMHRLKAATLAPGIPKRGFLHPVLAIPVESVRARFLGDGFPSDAKVEVNYGLVQGGGGFENDPDDVNALPQFEILSTLQPVTTEFDVNGKVLVIDNYVHVLRDENNEPIGSELQPPQAGEVEVTEDMHTIIARRRERVSPGIVKAPGYTNTINSERVFNDPKHYWKLAIGGTTDDGGDTWNVVYEFQRNTDTWNKVIVWRDSETGQPGVDVTRPDTPDSVTPGSTGNGSKITQHYPARNFRTTGPTGLNLPIFD